MPDPGPFDHPLTDPLILQALLYASGELPREEAEAFERRLGAEQSAREALATAVHLSRPIDSGRPTRPSPVYRRQVAARLCGPPGLWERIAAPRLYRGHPALWGLAGAAAAVLVMLAWGGLSGPAGSLASVPPPAASQPSPPGEAGSRDKEPPSVDASAATIWASLHSSEHLVKAHDEQARRKARSNDRVRSLQLQDHFPMPPDPYRPKD
jgi:hypothetical protein